MLKTFVIGNLGKDATINTVNGRSVINFSVAHTENFTDSQGTKQQRTTWVECAYWTDRTAVAPYLKKGTMVFVEGQPHVDTYTTRDNRTSAAFRLRVERVQLLGGNKDGNQGTANRQPNEGIPVHSSAHTTNGGPGYVSDSVDDLPF